MAVCFGQQNYEQKRRNAEAKRLETEIARQNQLQKDEISRLVVLYSDLDQALQIRSHQAGVISSDIEESLQKLTDIQGKIKWCVDRMQQLKPTFTAQQPVSDSEQGAQAHPESDEDEQPESTVGDGHTQAEDRESPSFPEVLEYTVH